MKNIITSAAIFFGIIIAANASDPMKSVNNYKQMGAANKAKQEMRLAGTQKTNAVNRTATNSTSYKNSFKKYDYRSGWHNTSGIYRNRHCIRCTCKLGRWRWRWWRGEHIE
jgi:hypothetical protein